MNNGDLSREVRDELCGNILPFWTERMPDPRGGFLGRIDGRGVADAAAPKGSVLNSRILWAFSASYRLSGDPEHLRMAERAKDELLGRFYDREYGGVFWSLDADGNPLDSRKQMYAQGFAIYGLSEYARACPDGTEALLYARKLYSDLEAHAFDAEYNGYTEALSREWGSVEDMRLSPKDQNDAKTTNTHLHIIEPYVNLYRVWPDEGLRGRICNLLDIFAERIIRPDGHLAMFFDPAWHCNGGLVSYGHDIEASWLLWEAVELLGGEALRERFAPLALRLADASAEGLCPDGSLRYESNPATGDDDGDRHWWVQAENVVGSFNAYQICGDEKYRTRAFEAWNYIKENIVDRERGEWLWSVRADGTPNRDDDKAGFWKCPYHNARMCLEMMNRTHK